MPAAPRASQRSLRKRPALLGTRSLFGKIGVDDYPWPRGIAETRYLIINTAPDLIQDCEPALFELGFLKVCRNFSLFPPGARPSRYFPIPLERREVGVSLEQYTVFDDDNERSSYIPELPGDSLTPHTITVCTLSPAQKPRLQQSCLHHIQQGYGHHESEGKQLPGHLSPFVSGHCSLVTGVHVTSCDENKRPTLSAHHYSETPLPARAPLVCATGTRVGFSQLPLRS